MQSVEGGVALLFTKPSSLERKKKITKATEKKDNSMREKDSTSGRRRHNIDDKYHEQFEEKKGKRKIWEHKQWEKKETKETGGL